jgi:asparagine synthase (glutamine-hydrolysing)
MCGIAGVIGPELDARRREDAVRRMVARERPRGPDDDGYVSEGAATLGMCRLAIFDPAHGHQPMVSDDGRYHLVFNGAIYNFRELRQRLEGGGASFRTECDTEVLLAAYTRYGDECVQHLRGMFAFAVWDRQAQRLFAARDALGASSLMPREIDPVAVGDFLAWFAVPAPRTIYRGIRNLPPGHSLSVDRAGRCQVRKWWRLPAAHRAAPRTDYATFVGDLRTQLEDTIRAHRLADVPVGAFLSGGLDSTAIAALMSRTGAGRLKTFSLIFNEADYSEAEPARLAAQAIGTEHHEEILTGARIAAEMPKILAQFDQPTGDGINTYYISQAARAGGVKVALSGLGGDELFGGYPSFTDMPRLARWIPLWRQVPGRVRQHVVQLLRRRGARARKLADFLHSARDLYELCSLELLAPEARRLAERQGSNHPMLDDFVFDLIGADPIQIVSGWEMRTYMSDVLLRDSDVLSMANSLELRVPFVDRSLVEWWWNQPEQFRFDPRRPKSALADAVADCVPAEIRSRRKRGFTLPFPLWMRRELRPFLAETFSNASFARCPWLDMKAAQREWTAFDQGNDDGNWGRVWTIAILIAFANRSEATS